MILNNLCMGCMKEKYAKGVKCPYCGYDDTVQENPQGMLPVWTILEGTYVVGKRLGNGGFGITYAGFDLNLEKKIAIKEFFPYNAAFRQEDQKTVIPMPGEEEFYREERDRFVEEARILAQLDSQPGVVKVNTYFRENNTAYIAMEFLEGISLLDYMKQRGGKIPAEELFTMMRPVVNALAGIHRKGVVHQDISPDNIMIDNRGKAKLIDFGAAYDAHSELEETRVYKLAYSPIEQIKVEGEATTASDVYALCATMYHALTGNVPDSALKRSEKDELKKPSELGVDIDGYREKALMQGLMFEPGERPLDAGNLYHFLYEYAKQKDASPEKIPDEIDKINKLRKKMQAEGKKERKRTKILWISMIALMFVLAYWSFRTAFRQKPTISSDSVSKTEQTNAALSDKEADKDALDVSKWRADLYESFGIARDETLESAANAMAAAYVSASFKTESEWENYFVKVADESMDAYALDRELESWLVLPYSGNTNVTQIMQDVARTIDQNNGGAVILNDVSRIGISVGKHSDGTILIVILYGI